MQNQRRTDWCDDGDPIGSDCRRWLEDRLDLRPSDLGDALEIQATDLPAGVAVARAGGSSRCAYVIRWGGVEVRRAAGERTIGQQAVLVTLGPGDVVGDVPLLLGRTYSHDVVTTAAVRLLTIDAPGLLSLVARRPTVAARWARSLAQRLAETHQRLDELLAGHLDAQLATILLRRAPAGGELRLTQREMAAQLGVQRSSITTAMTRLERRGFVRRGYGHVVIVDPDGLRQLI